MSGVLLRRVRTSQPQTPTRLSPYWVSRGLVLAIQQDWYATPYGTFPLVKTNSPANLPSAKGRVSGFGTTYAGNTNSYLTGPVLTHPKSGWRSWFVLLYAASTGGGGIGRVFQHATGTGGDGAGGEGLFCVATTNELRYQKWNNGTFVSEYKTPAAITTNAWTSYGLTHQQIVGDTLPNGYKNGVAETWSILTANGQNNLSSAPLTTMAIGNRPSDVARTWDGMIGVQLYFDGFLSAADHAALHANPYQVFSSDIIPLFWSSNPPQIVYPNGDVAGGAWLPSTGTDLYACIDETSASDTDYIYTTVPGAYQEFTFPNCGAVDPSTGGHVRYRIPAGTGTITAILKQGSTTLQTLGTHTLTGSAQDIDITISASVADSDDLRVGFTASA